MNQRQKLDQVMMQLHEEMRYSKLRYWRRITTAARLAAEKEQKKALSERPAENQTSFV